MSLVLLAALGIAVAAFVTGSDDDPPVGGTAEPNGETGTSPTSPPASTTSPSPEGQGEAADLVEFRRVDVNLDPIGCEGDLTFAWTPDRGDESLVGETAVIRVTGPQVAGTYRETFTPEGFSLTFHVTLGPRSRWTAVALSVGGRPANPLFEVETSIDALTFC